MIPRPGRYRDFAGGEYEVIGTARRFEGGDEVLFRALNEAGAPLYVCTPEKWVEMLTRGADEFSAPEEVPLPPAPPEADDLSEMPAFMDLPDFAEEAPVPAEAYPFPDEPAAKRADGAALFDAPKPFQTSGREDGASVDAPQSFPKSGKNGDAPQSFPKSGKNGDAPRSFSKNGGSGGAAKPFQMDEWNGGAFTTSQTNDWKNGTSSVPGTGSRTGGAAKGFQMDEWSAGASNSFPSSGRNGGASMDASRAFQASTASPYADSAFQTDGEGGAVIDALLTKAAFQNTEETSFAAPRDAGEVRKARVTGDIHAILKSVYGYSAFREGQEDVIGAILDGRDVLGVMPTGAGKSLCYQIPALAMEGCAIVISPLISLMKDQVNALTQAGVPAAFLNSSLSERQTAAALSNARGGKYKIIYVAPERLLTGRFLSLAAEMNLSMIAVDEAHCISQWGQDFRPAYLDIPEFIRRLPARPRLCAFTATATERVRADIRRLIGLREPLELVTGFDRPNLYYRVLRPANKREALTELLNGYRGMSGIIYCATRRQVEEICDSLKRDGFRAARYHAANALRLLLALALAVCLLHVWSDRIMDTGLVPLDEYGGKLPFATMRELAAFDGAAVTARLETMRGLRFNSVEEHSDWLAPRCISYHEVADFSRSDGTALRGGLYIGYVEAAAPWLAHRFLQERWRYDRAQEHYRPLDAPALEADEAVAYESTLHFPTVLIRRGNVFLCAYFYQFDDPGSVTLPPDTWCALLAQSLPAS